MLKRRLAVLLLSLCVMAPVCLAANVPHRIGKWRVEVGPAGNEFYQARKKKKVKAKPPSDAVLRYTRIFVPHVQVTDWELDDDVYEISCERGDEEYKFEVTPQGELIELQYENDETDIEEQADELVLWGTKRSLGSRSYTGSSCQGAAQCKAEQGVDGRNRSGAAVRDTDWGDGLLRAAGRPDSGRQAN
ncbi:MAG: hypothetical protein ACYS76_10420 [Planctomycetota bacterium]|jgi:hypothetical protein